MVEDSRARRLADGQGTGAGILMEFAEKFVATSLKSRQPNGHLLTLGNDLFHAQRPAFEFFGTGTVVNHRQFQGFAGWNREAGRLEMVALDVEDESWRRDRGNSGGQVSRAKASQSSKGPCHEAQDHGNEFSQSRGVTDNENHYHYAERLASGFHPTLFAGQSQ